MMRRLDVAMIAATFFHRFMQHMRTPFARNQGNVCNKIFNFTTFSPFAPDILYLTAFFRF